MTSRLRLLLSSVTVALLMACAGGPATTVNRAEAALSVPDWFLNPGQATEMPYGVATSYSRDIGIAREQAVSLARVDLARQIEVRIESLIETNQGQAGGVDPAVTQYFNQAAREVLQTELVGVRIETTDVQREAIGYRVYVMVVQDIAAANRALLEQLRAEDALYAEFQKTEAFERLDAELRRLERGPGDPGTSH